MYIACGPIDKEVEQWRRKRGIKKRREENRKVRRRREERTRGEGLCFH